MKIAKHAFRFRARFVLTFATSRAARDLAELRAGIAELPDAVLYRHTFRFLAEHESLVPEPPNDFSLWASDALGDEVLAERLAAVDTLAFSELSALRAELLRVIDEFLAEGHDRAASPAETFRFLSAKRYSMPTGLKAWTLDELADGVRRAGPSSLYLHLFEAKLRPPLGVNDFSQWLEGALEEPELARRVADLDLYHFTLADVRRKILGAIEEGIHAGA